MITTQQFNPLLMTISAGVVQLSLLIEAWKTSLSSLDASSTLN